MARRKRRNTYGDGTIYQDKASGRWVLEFPDGRGGRIKRRAASRQEAESIQAQFVAQRKKRLNIKGGAQTLREFVAAWWERAIVPRMNVGDLRPKTIDDLHRTLDLYVLPYLGAVILIDIDAPLVLDMVNDVRRDYGPAAADRALTKLIQVLNAAVRWRHIDANPAVAARFDVPAYKHKSPIPLTTDEARRLLIATRGHRLEALYHIALILGLRRGELLGLSWHDLDRDVRTLTIRQQVQKANGKHGIVKWTKSDAGERTLPVPPYLMMKLLERERLWRQEARQDGWQEHFLIFPSDVGTPMHPDNLRHHLEKMCRRAGIRRVTPHALRHTVGTRLGEQGVLEEVRAAILGHGKRGVTQLYTHAQLLSMREALEVLEQVLRAA